MPKISALPPIAAVASDDENPARDTSAGSTGKWSFNTLKTWLQSLAGWISTAMLADSAVTSQKIDFTTFPTDTDWDSGWILPTFNSGWSSNGSATVAYKKVGGVVYLRGQVTRSAGLDQSTIFTLPAGLRPAVQRIWTVPGSSLNYGKLVINTDGTVSIAALPSGGAYLGIDAVSFPNN